MWIPIFLLILLFLSYIQFTKKRKSKPFFPIVLFLFAAVVVCVLLSARHSQSVSSLLVPQGIITGSFRSIVVIDDILHTSQTDTNGLAQNGIANRPFSLDANFIVALFYSPPFLFSCSGQTVFKSDTKLKTTSDMQLDLDFSPLSVAVIDDWTYLTGLQKDANKILAVSPSGNKIYLNLTMPKGLAVHKNLLYVADKDRVIVFRDRLVVRILAPIMQPIRLLIWQDFLVVAQSIQTQLFTLDGILFATIPVSSFGLAASSKFLYIMGKSAVFSYAF